MPIYLPQLGDDPTLFPDLKEALADPDGLLAMGGDLSVERISNAYHRGIFPWFSQGDPILWWSPSERATIQAGQVHISRSMKRLIKKMSMTVTVNHDFLSVINACAKPRATQKETWITQDMIDAYYKLHLAGIAHSIEVWHEQKLVGGLYGLCIGQLFCGESMFSTMDNSSKIAFIALNQHFKSYSGKEIDCQMQTSHLHSLGVSALTREQFLTTLAKLRGQSVKTGCWDKQPIHIKL
ncbi:leucyl/phenylalanyl-tRNA--protein transferase [Psychromonas sp. KJ10-10]|uniref:leucyl/phenylalanyl-tRNA--protein transferase n=1 Tax=Psychromonas sp. KJ10-10 TaxID=3391823 RepID=UPI0039B536D2